ncbi:hypothetical protein DMH25_08075 [Streptomyces sp. WAC 01325]|uniref:hypothetical protein n=1 Tax=Streptomyces sp. WAC 01325 TaxID=2203202 RepID=UPI000F8880CE|nr:hypothetical protein [Streptomyces sp. WAC 01325]RSN13738.1 hypothetical protein DMH25_08075 [Streptomyces sp. WAC 01325]
MIIVYTPEGGEPEQYDARSLRTSEASIVQRTAGMKWGEVEQGLDSDDPEAMRAIVWVLKKRAEPSLRYGDFDPLIGEMTSRMDRREVTEYVENAFRVVDTDPDVTRDQVAAIVQRIIKVAADPEHAEQLIAEMQQGPKEPAAEEQPAQDPPSPDPSSSTTPTSTSSGESGSDSSPTSSTSPPTESTG